MRKRSESKREPASLFDLDLYCFRTCDEAFARGNFDFSDLRAAEVQGSRAAGLLAGKNQSERSGGVRKCAPVDGVGRLGPPHPQICFRVRTHAIEKLENARRRMN